MNILGLILARKGSERLPGKNRLALGGTAMVNFAIDAINETPEITHKAISTDDEDLGRYCERQGVPWIQRPAELCTSTSDISEAIEHVFKMYPMDYVVSFQCAVPLRPAGSTSALIQEVIKSGTKGGLSVVKRTPWMWNVQWIGGTKHKVKKLWHEDQYPRSQDIGNTYEEINSIMVTHNSMVGKRWGYPMSFVVLPSWADFDIDDEDDYDYCCRMWEFLKSEYYINSRYKTFTIDREV